MRLASYARVRVIALEGLQHSPPANVLCVDLNRVTAAALSRSSTSALMILLKAAHLPAGATTLIISLGITAKPTYLIVVEVAVALLVGQAIFFNKLAGLDYPFSAKREPIS